ncbi:glycosyltransferase family A protein [Singulisphaera sp. Ch08]|uniref:Glycosyltransferase family A protein n=1 Tax=Singulisphaera sp. Ch08 TaxID=3120278 RepID=A0AAU7CDC7_9BACT
MPNPLISTVIPAYNYERYVTAAVESALAQSYPHQEVIVVDDGSTDETRKRLAPYEGRIRYLYQENRGLSAARNSGIRAARGEFVAFLDADDLWHPEKLATQVRYLMGHPELALLAASHRVIGGGDIGRFDWPRVDGSQPIVARPVSFDELVVGSRFGACAVVARKWCFQEIGMFDESLRSAEDLDMWIRIASRFPVAMLDVPLWLYRIHGTNMHDSTARMELNTLRMIDKVFEEPGALSRSSLLKRKALANISINLAYGYRDSQTYGMAVSRIARSFLLWPFPYPGVNMTHLHPLARLKFLAVVLARAASFHLGLDPSTRPGNRDPGTPTPVVDPTRCIALKVES